MINGVLFDLDGTLLDTAPDLVGALNFVRETEALPPLDWRDYKHFASRGALGLIEGGMPKGDAQQTEQRKALLLGHYAKNIYRETKPFDGIEALLDALMSRAVPWGIVTNKPEYLTIPLLDQAGISRSASCVVCGDTLKFSKPHPAPVTLACSLLGVSPEHTLMIGDDKRDLEAGRAAGTRTALALYGYIEPGVKAPNPAPDWSVAQPLEILNLVEQNRVSVTPG